jgi:Flp pilus assembly CpaE family ATPase
VRKALTKVADRFYILSGPNKAIVRPRHEPKEILRLVNYARQLAGVLVLDLPSSFDDVYFATLEMAHHVVLVGQQDINSLRGLRLLNETLTNRGAASVPHVVLNRFNPSFIDFRVEAIQRTSGWERISTVANDYKGVSTAANHGMVLRDAAPSSPALADIRTLAHEILGLGRPERSAPARPLHRRLSKLLSMKVVLTA